MEGKRAGTPDLLLYRPKNETLPSLDALDWRERLDEGGVAIGAFALDPECRREILVPDLLGDVKNDLSRLSAGVYSVSVYRPGVKVVFDKGADSKRVLDDLACAVHILERVEPQSGAR